MNKATQEALNELRDTIDQETVDTLTEITEHFRHRRDVLGFAITVDEILDRLDDEIRILEGEAL